MNSIGAVNDSHFDSMQTDFNDNDDKENLHISNTENMMHWRINNKNWKDVFVFKEIVSWFTRGTIEILLWSKLLIENSPLGAISIREKEIPRLDSTLLV